MELLCSESWGFLIVHNKLLQEIIEYILTYIL